MDLGARVRALFGARPPAAADGAVTRSAAAQMCARALRQRGLFAIVHAPRGDAGRVAVMVGLLRQPQIVPLGWLEVPLSGAIAWNDHGAALAVQITPTVLSIVRACMHKRRVIPVAPDARVVQVNEHAHVMQAATGIWQVVERGGNVRVTADSLEIAVEAARKVDPERSSSVGASAGTAIPITLEPAQAARWLAHHLRELGIEASASGAEVRVGGECATIHVGGTVTFTAGMPAEARAAVEAGVRLVRVVESFG